MKKQSNLSRLMGYAGGHKILTYLSWVLSVMSALLALVPFWYIWCIIHDILEVSPDFSQAENVTGYGWSAVLFAVIWKAAENSKRFQCCYGNVSCTQASRQSGGDCHPYRATFPVACF